MKAEIEGAVGVMFPEWSFDRVEALCTRHCIDAVARLGTIAEALKMLAALQRLAIGKEGAENRTEIASICSDINEREGYPDDVLGALSDVSSLRPPAFRYGYEISSAGAWRYEILETLKSRYCAVCFRGRVVAGFSQAVVRQETCCGDEIV